MLRLHFENWIKKDGNISERTESLIDESILCYRAQAYKAAYLFSFLSFQNIIRERILLADAPVGYEEKYWRTIQENLRNDDKWEPVVMECIDKQKPGSIFKLSDQMKHQYFYWKDRRNDCAHAKDNQISSSHVESFWLFFESNIAKFGVGGGKEALIEKLKMFFDLTFTPISENPEELIKEIPRTVKTEDYKELLEKIYAMTKGSDYKTSRIEFWHQLFILEGDFRDKLIEFLKLKKGLCTDILVEDSSKVIYFGGDKQFVRSLWYEMKNTYLTYKVVFGLLRNKLIPSEQIYELVKTVTKNNNDSLFHSVSESELQVLDESGFFKEFQKFAFTEMAITDFDWARENRHIIGHLISRHGFNEDIVTAINTVFYRQNTPWKLGDKIGELLENNPALKNQYLEISRKIGGVIPDRFLD